MVRRTGTEAVTGVIEGKERLFLIFLLIIVQIICWHDSVQGKSVLYTDKLGRTVTIPVPVKRAVFFQMYEMIPVLDVWDRVVGIGRYAYENDLIKTVKPTIERTIPAPGSGIDVNMEVLMKVKPDLVITWTFKPEQVRFMEERGLRVVALYPESLHELYDVVQFLGRVFEREKEAKQAITRMESLLNEVRKRIAKVPLRERRKVLWIGSRPTYVAGLGGMTHDLITLCGGINAAASIGERSTDVSIERIIGWNPDVVFIWGNARYSPHDILRNTQWSSVKAVKSGQVYKAPEWSTWSPRVAPVALWMAMKIYPEHFRDIRFDTMVDSFYRKMFRVPYRMVKVVNE